MDYPKIIVSNQKEESISIQRVKSGKFLRNLYWVSDNLSIRWNEWTDVTSGIT